MRFKRIRGLYFAFEGFSDRSNTQSIFWAQLGFQAPFTTCIYIYIMKIYNEPQVELLSLSLFCHINCDIRDLSLNYIARSISRSVWRGVYFSLLLLCGREMHWGTYMFPEQSVMSVVLCISSYPWIFLNPSF